MSYLLDALGYAGDSLAKPGRAVRGLLGGRPDELLAALPFSDSLGLTDQANQITGHDLLRQLGMDPGDGIGGTLAGVGMDIATDPLTYAGGALLRGLGVGRMGSKAGADSHIFDLVSPEERALFAKNSDMIDNAFPVPVRPEVPPAVAARETAASPLADALGVTDAADPGMIHTVPNPDDYSHMIGGYGHTAIPAGPLADMVDEGDRLGAFTGSLGGWDHVLGDLNRLSPEAKAAIRGDQWYHDGIDVADIPGGPDGQYWKGEIGKRIGDLDAMQQFHSASLAPPELMQRAGDQLQALMPLADGSYGSPAEYVASQIGAARVRPSDIPGILSNELEHLPLDPRGMRRLAALAQRNEAMGLFTHELNYLSGNGAVPIRDLPTMIGSADHGFSIHSREQLRQGLLNALDPAPLIEGGVEPGVAYSLLRHPPEGQHGDMLREALMLLESLGVRPDPWYIARAAQRGASRTF